MIDHRVCLLRLHVKGRPPRPAVRTGETGKSKRTSTGWNRARYGMGTPDSSGTGRKQAMDAMASQDLRNAFSAKAFLVEAGKRNPFPASTGKKESNHGLNDKPGNVWYPEPVVRGKRKRRPPAQHLENRTAFRISDQQGRKKPSLIQKPAREPASDEQRLPSGYRRIQQRLSESQTKEYHCRAQ